MRNKAKVISILMVAVFLIGAVTPTNSLATTVTDSDILETSDNDPTATIAPAEVPDAESTEAPEEDSEQPPEEDLEDSEQKNTQKYTFMGQYYVAKGQPCVFQEPKKGKIKVISAAGNKYEVSGNKLTIICKKKGMIEYKINGKKRYIELLVGGNNKDSKVNKKEYDCAAVKYNGKPYTNFIDVIRERKEDTDLFLTLSSKKEMKKGAKYNRGIKYGSTQKNITKQYPSWEDVGSYENDSCCYVARYYDKKSNFVVVKGFVHNKKSKVKKIVYIGYKNETIKLQVVKY